jgi:hypothetical protein
LKDTLIDVGSVGRNLKESLLPYPRCSPGIYLEEKTSASILTVPVEFLTMHFPNTILYSIT